MAEYSPTSTEVVLTIAPVGSTEDLLVCIVDLSFTGSSTTITTDTKCGTEVTPGAKSQTITGSVRRAWDPDSGRVSEVGLYQAWYDDTHIQFTYAPVASNRPNDRTPVYTGTGYVTQYGNNDAASAAPTGNFTITCDEPMLLTEDTPS